MKSSVAWLLIEKVSRILSGLLIGSAVAKYLGPAEYGVFSVSVATIAMFVAASNMGADHVNISEITKRKDEWPVYVSSALLARLSWSLGGLILAILYCFFVPQSEGYLVLILLPCIPMASFGVLTSALLARGLFRLVSGISVAVLLISAAIRLHGIYIGAQSSYFAWCATAEALLLPLVSIAFLVRYSSLRSFLSVSWDDYISYLKLCIPIAISAVLVNMYLRLELFAVNYLLGVTQAGLWAAATMFITPWAMVAASILPVANRSLAKLNGFDSANYDESIVRLIRLMFWVSVVLWCVNVFAISFVVPYILGRDYVEIIPVVIVGSLNLIPIFMGCAQDMWLAHQRKTSTVLKKVLLGIPISAIFLYFGTTRFGLLGAAISMVCANVITTVLLNSYLDKRFLSLQAKAIFSFR